MKTRFSHYVDVYDRASRNPDHTIKKENHYQSVYSSQIYGTFFSVYAKFNLDISKSDIPNGVYHVDSVDFKVANYKGILDIGIQNVILPKDLQSEIDGNPNLTPTEKKALKPFILNMRAMGGFDGPGHSQPKYDVNEKLDIKISSRDVLYFRRVKLPLHSDNSALKNGIFDNEFYFRESPDITKRNVRTAHTDNRRPNLAEEAFESFESSGILCPTSENYVI